jgi:hypothetical protein
MALCWAKKSQRIGMSKKDLADVLVKLSGFGFVIGGIYSICGNIISMSTTGLAHPTAFGSHPESFGGLIIPAFSILFGSYLIRNSVAITAWIFKDDKTP